MMKKYLVLFVVLAISQMMVAQSLIGTWKDYDESDGITHLVFQSNKFEKKSKTRKVFEKSGYSCTVTLTFSGSYKKEGNVIRVTLNKCSVVPSDFQFDSKLSEEEENKILTEAYAGCDYIAQAYNSKYPSYVSYIIKSLTANELTYLHEGKAQKYKRVK